MNRRVVTGRRMLGLVVSLVGLSLLTMSPAGADGVPEDDVDYFVTIAARACPDYADIMANRARNNIQESLRDLGKDSVYSTGSPVRPAVEDPNDPDCDPLDDWVFQFGDGSGGPKVDNLSTVTNPGRISAQTGTVPLLDDDGLPTGQNIEGAVNVRLTPAELALAQRRNLWVQGGTRTDPLLYGQPVNASETYGFGALRCAIDNLNGDNVEFIGFPSSSRRVFCYYYTVRRAPEPGTIIVRKELNTGSDTHTFQFNGNISYVPGGDFSLTVNNGAPAQTSFIRAAGDTWDFTEQSDPSYEPTGPPVCVSRDGDSGVAITGQRTAVTLASEDVVTCTYTNRRRPTGPLRLDKVTSGGIGTFGFTIIRPDATVLNLEATTTEPGLPANVFDVPDGGQTGTYTVTETLPSTPGGTWDLTQVECDGTPVPLAGNTATLDIGAGDPKLCTAFNTFTPDGALTITKTTVGGTGSFDYLITDLDSAADESEIGEQTAVTTAPGDPETATGTPLVNLPVYRAEGSDAQVPGRRYQIQELSPPDTVAGSWQLTDADCEGVETQVRDGGSLVVELTPTQPDLTCAFENTFVPNAEFSLTKELEGELSERTGDVVVRLECTDGTQVDLTGPAGEPGPFGLDGQPYVFSFDDPGTAIECDVAETETGARTGARVTTTIDVRVDGTDLPPVEGDEVSVRLTPGVSAEVLVTNRYAAAPSPSPTPTPEPTPEPTPDPTPQPIATVVPGPDGPGGAGNDRLAAAGGGWVGPLGALGGVLVLAGLVMMLLSRRGGATDSIG